MTPYCILGALLAGAFFAIIFAISLIADVMTGIPMDNEDDRYD